MPKAIKVEGKPMGNVMWTDYHKDVLSWHGVVWYQDDATIYIPMVSDEMRSTQRLPLGW
jgi:hypothetical protein